MIKKKKKMRGDLTKFLFIDSALDDGKVRLPAKPFSCHGHEQMSLTLIQFTMKRNFPLINRYNNTFYLYDTLNKSYYEVVIQGGVYNSFDTGSENLKTAIQDAVTATILTAVTRAAASPASPAPNHIPAPNITAVTVGYDTVLRCFTFVPTITGVIEPDNTLEIRCFHLKTNSAAPAGVTINGTQSDVHEILGVKTIFDAANPFNCVGVQDTLNNNVISSTLLYGFYPASLSTLDNLYIRCNFDTGNYESPDLDVRKEKADELQHSFIFAKVPIMSSNESESESHRLIVYEDANDVYQKILPMKSLGHLQFFVTDKRNRKMAAFAKQQEEFGQMHFDLVMRWDKFVGPKEMEHESVYDNRLPPKMSPATYGYGQPRM